MALIATILAIASPSPVISTEGCNTQRCEGRVERRFKRNHVRPYRGWLRKVRMCESGGNYSTNTGNSFYGAYQFTLSSWRGAGGSGMPHLNPRYEQDYRAVRWAEIIGWGNVHSPAGWPVCG